MTGIRHFLTDDHRACDTVYVEMEQALASGTEDAAASACARFVNDMERHFQREEAVLFPSLEEATGMRQGPTLVMRMEHDQMRGLMQDLTAAVARGDRETGLGFAETLLIMIQQHNLKEEQILYPMADRQLAGQADALLERMQAVES